MKKLLFSLSLLASLATIAGESSVEVTAQVFGTLPVTANTKSVIVSVPWVASGYGDSAISVSNIIKTAGLTAGDTLRTFDDVNNVFNVWTLNDNGSGVLYWAGVNVITTNGTASSVEANVKTLKRGGAMILTRNDSYTEGSSYTFQVYGQCTNTPESVSTVCAKRSGDVAAYTLIAPPGTADVKINDLTWKNVGANDYLVTEGGKRIYYSSNDEKWGSWGVSKGSWAWVESSATNTAGKGMWYVANTKDASNNPTVEW